MKSYRWLFKYNNIAQTDVFLVYYGGEENIDNPRYVLYFDSARKTLNKCAYMMEHSGLEIEPYGFGNTHLVSLAGSFGILTGEDYVLLV